ncbi:STAS domain-containing protein [Butyrivibrio sp. FCS014]|uniref:STAS domain-containing protein n=1 Tax=Butyrivibrio sp. FCS014 TaxID=1408304 RepID=UPI0004B668C7|nr:STAS domain-containing protein [Butyrivibrio sp. FCS014]
MLDIKIDRNGSTLDAALEGMLDTKTAPQLSEAIITPISELEEINLDFAKLEYLTSAGLRVILEAQQEMDDKNGKLTIKNVNEEIMEVFEMTGFVDVLTII